MAAIDRARKMPLYAQQGVKNFWLVDPIEKTLEVYENNMGKWLLLHTYANDDKVRAVPFDAIEIELSSLWT
jgi:Uma2 family endonuclease